MLFRKITAVFANGRSFVVLEREELATGWGYRKTLCFLSEEQMMLLLLPLANRYLSLSFDERERMGLSVQANSTFVCITSLTPTRKSHRYHETWAKEGYDV